jgi:hypothetical protein
MGQFSRSTGGGGRGGQENLSNKGDESPHVGQGLKSFAVKHNRTACLAQERDCLLFPCISEVVGFLSISLNATYLNFNDVRRALQPTTPTHVLSASSLCVQANNEFVLKLLLRASHPVRLSFKLQLTLFAVKDTKLRNSLPQ